MNPELNPDISSRLLLLPRMSKQVMRRASSERLGIDRRLLMALSYLGDHDGAPQHELADALCIDAKNVVLLLNELEDAGYLVRRRDTEDRRRHHVFITDAGRAAIERAGSALQAIEDEILRALDAEERATLWDLLTRAVRTAEPTADAACDPAVTPLPT
jgi:DNA-binding MarR family transcriptional regulator